MANRSRKNGIKIYFDDDEVKLLDAKMKAAGFKNRSKFIRELVRLCAVYNIDYSYLQEYSYQLSKIGTNINQIATVANESQSIYEDDVKKLKEEMEKICQLQRSMQSQEPLINP